jgi:hypothetical protein
MAETQQEQTAHMGAEPQHEHQWLEKLVGEWEMEGSMDAGPDKPTETSRGEETVRSVGGLWIVAEGEGEVPGGERGTSVMTLGYDPSKGKFVGTWIGSMMTHMWVYEGELDGEERVLTLETEGPDMSAEAEDGRLARYRESIELESDDHRTLRSLMRGKDGKWRQLVEIHYRRK